MDIELRNYFQKRGFEIVKDVGSAPVDLPLRIIWGGAGTLMTADCSKVHKLSTYLWEVACEKWIVFLGFVCVITTSH